jgi:copper chaperone CopZ
MTGERLEYTVEGMSCDHCVRAVRDEVETVDGVASVAVDLATKRVTVAGDGLSDASVRAAIAEAGYEARA